MMVHVSEISCLVPMDRAKTDGLALPHECHQLVRLNLTYKTRPNIIPKIDTLMPKSKI